MTTYRNVENKENNLVEARVELFFFNKKLLAQILTFFFSLLLFAFERDQRFYPTLCKYVQLPTHFSQTTTITCCNSSTTNYKNNKVVNVL